MELSVIIPAYNEAKRIAGTLDTIADWLQQRRGDSEIIVVNNNSTDDTADRVRDAMKRHRTVRLIDEPRAGKGYAVAAGMRFSAGRIRLFTDADNSTDISHFGAMEPFFTQGYDVVIGSLAVKGARIEKGGAEPLWRVMLGKLGNLWIQLWAVPGIWDTQRGFKAFSAKAANDIFTHLTIFGWGFDVDVLACARAHGYRIREIPIVWNNPPETRVNVWAYPKVLVDTVRVGLKRISGAYGK